MIELEAHNPNDPRHVMLHHFKEAVLDAMDKARQMDAFFKLDGITQAEVVVDGSIIGALVALAFSKQERVPDLIVELLTLRFPKLVMAANAMFENSVERMH